MTYAAEYPQDVAGLLLLDSTSPRMFTGISTYPVFYEVYRRVSALFPSLARIGVGRLAYRSNFDFLPAADRDVQLAFWCTARHARSGHDEWAEAPKLMQQAAALETLGSRPLVVLTAARDAQQGWLPLQDELARLSTNCSHRVLPNASHSSLVQNPPDVAQVSEAIHDVVEAVRTSTAIRGS